MAIMDPLGGTLRRPRAILEPPGATLQLTAALQDHPEVSCSIQEPCGDHVSIQIWHDQVKNYPKSMLSKQLQQLDQNTWAAVSR